MTRIHKKIRKIKFEFFDFGYVRSIVKVVHIIFKLPHRFATNLPSLIRTKTQSICQCCGEMHHRQHHLNLSIRLTRLETCSPAIQMESIIIGSYSSFYLPLLIIYLCCIHFLAVLLLRLDWINQNIYVWIYYLCSSSKKRRGTGKPLWMQWSWQKQILLKIWLSF